MRLDDICAGDACHDGHFHGGEAAFDVEDLSDGTNNTTFDLEAIERGEHLYDTGMDEDSFPHDRIEIISVLNPNWQC